jgi:ABC-type lipoprotein export system ATPase subunit
MSDRTPIIRAKELTKTYGGTAAVNALRGITLEVQRGERVALLGKSGSGKSTLLNLIGGLDQPSGGSIEVYGRDLQSMRSKELAHHRLHTVGMIFQSFNLIASRTALENVVLPLVLTGMPRLKRWTMAATALAHVGLKDRAQHRPAELSGGEQQRVAIARALVNDPKVLLADEPTGNLDSGTASEILRLLEDHLRSRGTTLVMVTHDEELASRATDRLVRLHDGQVVDAMDSNSDQVIRRRPP